MSEITTIDEITHAPRLSLPSGGTPAFRAPNRVGDALLRLTILQEDGSYIGVDLLSECMEESDLTNTQRTELQHLVTSRKMFLHLKDLGDRVATFNVIPKTSTITRKGLASAVRKEVAKLKTEWNAMLSDLRESKWLQEQSDMTGEEFTYRTLAGARFPHLKSRADLARLRVNDVKTEYSLFTSFSTWKGLEKAYIYDDDGNGAYSTSAKDSQHIYEPLTVDVEMDLKGSQRDGFQLPLPKHARKRLKHYGFDESELTLKSNVETAMLSSGRSVPSFRDEWPKPLKAEVVSTYKVTFELNNIDLLFKSGEIKNNKIVVSCHINTTVDKVVYTLKEYIDILRSRGKPLKLSKIFVVTVMMREIPTEHHGVRCTGLPVIPSYVTSINREGKHVVKGISSPNDKRSVDDLILTLEKDLIDTDQWINIKNSELKRFMGSNPNMATLPRITQCGVEFADVEMLRLSHKAIFNELERIGIKMLFKQIRRSLYSQPLTFDEVKLMYEEYYDKFSGPSIVHSEEIRSPEEKLAGVKPIDSSLLIVRIVLSTMLNVGVSESMHTHDSTNANTPPLSHHLLNQKRVESLLIPLSVMKDQLLVYSLSGPVGKLLKDVKGRAIEESRLGDIIASSYNFTEELSVFQLASAQAIFTVTTPIALVGDRSEKTPLTLLSPSGLEFDVCPIIEEICYKLNTFSTRLPQSRAVVSWHPLFCIIVVATPAKYGKMSFQAIVLPAKRKSSIASSYHNVDDSLSVLSNSDIRVHFAMMREDKGFASALRTYASIYGR
uniref:Uncharacterized protein n=1 Tax=viral metagenome TaxID=1070528 RepID=A0A2V0RB84_9ZZZZ